MDLKQIYREIVNEHNLHPGHKEPMTAPKIRRRGSNPTCGDDITIELDVDEQGIISAAAFQGEGCAVSQASTDILLDMIEGKEKSQALLLVQTFMRMVRGEASEEEIESLEEAASLQDVAHMPARVKCATLAWHTLEKMLSEEQSA